MTNTEIIPQQYWNFGRKGVQSYIDTLLRNWPTDMYFCGLCKNILISNKKLLLTPKDNPVRETDKLWNNTLITGKSSWDSFTVLFAVKPQYFKIDSTGCLMQNNKFQTYWNKEINNPKQFRIISSKLSNVRLQKMPENLISDPPLK